jgi:hypothetical protein
MRHAVIATHLMTKARTAAAEAHGRQDVDAPAEWPAASERRPGRLAGLLHHAPFQWVPFRRGASPNGHAQPLDLRAESPVGERSPTA